MLRRDTRVAEPGTDLLFPCPWSTSEGWRGRTVCKQIWTRGTSALEQNWVWDCSLPTRKWNLALKELLVQLNLSKFIWLPWGVFLQNTCTRQYVQIHLIYLNEQLVTVVQFLYVQQLQVCQLDAEWVLICILGSLQWSATRCLCRTDEMSTPLVKHRVNIVVIHCICQAHHQLMPIRRIYSIYQAHHQLMHTTPSFPTLHSQLWSCWHSRNTAWKARCSVAPSSLICSTKNVLPH